MMKHDLYKREDGLAHCKICNGAEGSLPSECPQRKLTEEEENDIQLGILDFKNQQWEHLKLSKDLL